MQVINQFIKGVNKDADDLLLPKDSARDVSNMRLIDVDGKGYVLSNVKGNQEAFNLTEGFIPCGYCEYNGIAYIGSYNPGSNQGEIGCYPAPQALVLENCGLTGFDQNNKKYAPLFNFTGNNNPRIQASASLPFRGKILDFGLSNQLEMFPREDYDGSVNLYIAQRDASTIVINTGFDQEGNCVSHERRYWKESFPNYVKLFHESPDHPIFTLWGLGNSGQLKSGSYIFFLRYTTESFNKTSFNSESNSVIITSDNWDVNKFKTIGDAPDQSTNKSVKFRISNLDVNYKYFEFGYMYVSGETTSYGIIDKLYEIDPLSTIADIEITGFEDTIVADVSEILKTKTPYDGAVTHTQMENRYFAANLFSTSAFNVEARSELVNLSKLISCRYDDSFLIKHRDLPSSGPSITNSVGDAAQKYDDSWNGIYNEPFNYYNYTGYFRSESYAFGVVWVLNDGSETEAYPIQGRDDLVINGPTNDGGVYRFPDMFTSNTVTGNNVSIMGIRFDITVAMGNLPPWVKENVSGFYIVRSKRNENLIYQGIVSEVVDSKNARDPRDTPNEACTYGDNPKVLRRTSSKFPIISGWASTNTQTPTETGANQMPGFPTIQTSDPSGVSGEDIYTIYSELRQYGSFGDSDDAPPINKDFDGWVEVIEDSYALFSSDHHFKGEFPYSNSFIQPFIQLTCDHNYVTAGIPKTLFYVSDSDYQYVPNDGYYEDIFNIAPSVEVPKSGFVSYFKEGAEDELNCLYYYLCQTNSGKRFAKIRNMEISCPSYLAFTSDQLSDLIRINTSDVAYPKPFQNVNTPSTDEQYGFITKRYICNMYETKPSDIDIIDQFVLKSTDYYKISNFISLQDAENNPNIISNKTFYKGDCFLQRTFIKLMENPIYNPTQTDDVKDFPDDPWGSAQINSIDDQHGFGNVISFITENAINSELRITDQNKGFFPGKEDTLHSYSYYGTPQESNSVNPGYSNVLSVKTYRGVDLSIPFLRQKKENAVIYSNRHLIGSFEDYYRIIDINAIREYDLRLGEILSIKELLGNLISVQEFGINRLYVNERAVLNAGSTQTSSGELLLGTGQILAEKAQLLSDNYGSQHQWSVLKTETSIYGVDYNKRKIWRVSGQNLQAVPISDTAFYRKEVTEICEIKSPFSDIIESIPDNPINTYGIVSSYDRKFNDIHFTFILNDQSKTIVFNEWQNSFQGSRFYISPFYVTINEDYFSFNPKIFPSMQDPFNYNLSPLGDAYVHDEGDYCVWYDNVDPEISYVEFIVNVHPETSKVFDQLDVNSSPDDLYKVLYETQHQISNQFPFISTNELDEWSNPRYLENIWRMPIKRAEVIQVPTNNIYEEESRLRGRYLKIRLEYQTKNSIFIKSALTKLRQSKN